MAGTVNLSYDIVATTAAATRALETLARQVDKLSDKLDRIDGRSARADVEVRDNAAQSKLDLIAAKIRDIAGKKATVKVDVDKSLGEKINQISLLGRNLSKLAMPAALTGSIPAILAVGGALSDMTGLAGIAVGALAAVGATAATLKIGLSGTGDAMKAIADGDAAKLNEALAKMAPSARATFTEVNRLKPAFDGLRLDVQQRLFENMSSTVAELGGTYMPILRTGMGGVASATNETIQSTLAWLKTAGMTRDVSTIFDNTAQSITNMDSVGVDLVSMFQDVATVGSSFLPGLASGFGAAADRAAEFITNARQTGALAQWMQQGLTVARQLGDVLGNIGGVIAGVFEAGQSSSAGFIENLVTITDKLNDIVNSSEGQTILETTFSTISDVMGNVTETVESALVPALGAAVAAVGPVVSALSAGLVPVVQALTPLLVTLANVAGAVLLPVVSSLTPVLLQIAQALTSALVPVLPGLTNAFVMIVQAMLPIISSLGTLSPMFATLAQVAAKLITAIAPFVQLFAQLFQSVLGALVGPLSQVIDLIGTAFADALNALFPVLPPLIDAFLAILNAVTPILPMIAQLAAVMIRALAPVLPTIVNALVELLNAFLPLLPVIVQLISALLPSLVQIINILAGVLSNVVIPAFVWFVDVVSGTVSVVVSVVSAIIGVVTDLLNFFNDFDANIEEIWNATWSTVTSVVTDAMNAVSGFITDALDVITSTWDSMWSGVSTTASDAWAEVSAFVMDGVNAFVGFWRSVWDTVTGIWNGFWGGVRDIAVGVWSAIEDYFHRLFLAHEDLWRGIANTISSIWNGFWNGVRDVAMAVWNAVSGFFTTQFNSFRATFTAVFNAVSATWSFIWNAISTAGRAIWNALSAFLTNSFNVFRGVFTTVFNAVSSTWSTIWNAISSVGRTIWSALSAFFSAGFNAFLNGFRVVWNAVSSVFSTVWNTISNVGRTVWSALSGFFGGAFAAFSGMFSSVWNGIVNTFRTVWGSISNVARSVWDGVTGIFRNGVNGIIDAINWMTSKVNVVLKFLLIPQIPTIARLESGGILGRGTPQMLASGGTVGPGFVTDGPTAIVGEGKQAYPEYVIPTDPQYRSRAWDLYHSLGTKLMAEGGILGGVGDWIGNAASNVWKGVTGAAASVGGAITDLNNWIGNGVAGMITSLVDGVRKALPSGLMGDIGVGIVRKAIDGVKAMIDKGYAAKQAAEAASGMGADNYVGPVGNPAAGLAFARAQVGKPYIWGGVGPAGYDCSGFMSAILNVSQGRNPYSRRGSTASFPWPGFKPGLSPGFQIGAFKGNPGHMAGTFFGVNVESYGSHGPAVGAGARGAANPLFNIRATLPMANGGVIDRPTFGLLGEAGPEAVVPITRPRRAAQVMEQAGLSAPGGGAVNITVATTPYAPAERLIAAALHSARLQRMAGRYNGRW